MKAEIKTYKGAVRLFIDGQIVPPDAYITYFTRNACYGDFAEMGYNLFSLPVIFTSKTYNENSQAPAYGPVFFDGDEPDFDILDSEFRKIIDACPNALIFPRMNISLSDAWERANPDELCDFGKAEIHRPCFSSDKWAEESMRRYGIVIDHIKNSDYAEHVIGYQFAAGNTEEWLPHDNKGSIGKRSREKFADRCASTGIEPSEENYYGFLSDIVSERIVALAKFTKERAGRDVLVGTFYGYTLECPFRTSCHHALEAVLECPDLDFLCSPVSYANERRLGRDHSRMLPAESLREHGKLYFRENDTRTALTRTPFPELPHFQRAVFGPRDHRDAVEMLKMHYAHCIANGWAHWWFDMWGGWYAHPDYRALLEKFLEISRDSLDRDLGSVSELAVVIDEKSCRYVSDVETWQRVVYNFRDTLGKIGTPYDCYLASDWERVKDRYKAVIILEMHATPLTESIIADAGKRGIGFFSVTPESCAVTTEELRELCRSAGVHLYFNKDAVVYANKSYLFVHTCTEGALELSLPEGVCVRPLIEGKEACEFFDACFGELFEFVSL